MTIKTGQFTGLIKLPVGSSTISSPPDGERFEFHNLVVSDSGGMGASIDLFLSNASNPLPDERIDRIELAANQTKRFLPVGVPSGKYLIATCSAIGCALHGEYTIRSGGS